MVKLPIKMHSLSAKCPKTSILSITLNLSLLDKPFRTDGPMSPATGSWLWIVTKLKQN